jgi:uncharacterized membrane protein YdjX (TVP38/TMEM64 family)
MLSKIFEIVISKKRVILAFCFLLILIIVLYLRETSYFDANRIIAFVEQFPIFSPVLFIFIYVFMTIFLAPTLPLNLAAGFLWGGFFGALITIIACALAAIAAFLIARYLAYDVLKNKFNNNFWNSLKGKVQKNDWKIIALTRLNPIFPFGLINYFYGLTPVSFINYLWSTVLFGLPLVALFSYLGDITRSFVLKGQTSNLVKNIFIISFIVTGLTILLVIINKYWQNKKNENNTFNSDKK